MLVIPCNRIREGLSIAKMLEIPYGCGSRPAGKHQIMKSMDFAAIKRFEDFKTLATDESLSKYEKIGFPNSFREGKEAEIFADIRAKLPLLDQKEKTILDIGAGCSDMPHLMLDHCRKQNHQLAFADSAEMLALLPDAPGVHKFPGFFPTTGDAIAKQFGGVDVILCYSVFHYIFADTDYLAFIDASIALLNGGGDMLIGDIPNLDKRNRFFASANGIAFHRAYMKTDDLPVITPNSPELNAIDDKVLDGIVTRARSLGCDAYILPQPAGLPMANRRDDILIRKP